MMGLPSEPKQPPHAAVMLLAAGSLPPSLTSSPPSPSPRHQERIVEAAGGALLPSTPLPATPTPMPAATAARTPAAAVVARATAGHAPSAGAAAAAAAPAPTPKPDEQRVAMSFLLNDELSAFNRRAFAQRLAVQCGVSSVKLTASAAPGGGVRADAMLYVSPRVAVAVDAWLRKAAADLPVLGKQLHARLLEPPMWRLGAPPAGGGVTRPAAAAAALPAPRPHERASHHEPPAISSRAKAELLRSFSAE